MAIPAVDFHFDRIRFDAVDGGRTDLGQHRGSLAPFPEKRNPVFLPRWSAAVGRTWLGASSPYHRAMP
jgi:hypothetical protein